MARNEEQLLNFWRVAGWGVAASLLLVAMQFSGEWQWRGSDFLFAGVLIGGVGLGLELAVRARRDHAWRIGCGIALVCAFLIIWINAAVGVFGSISPAAPGLVGLLLLNGFFATLWLLAAWQFRRAARAD